MEKRCRSELIDNLYIAAPCTISWDAMEGDDRKRLCMGCSRDVFNISDMTRKEADRFLEENGTSQCMIFYRRQDGTVMTDNCPVGLRKLRDKAKVLARTVASAVAFAVSWTAALAQPGCDKKIGNRKIQSQNVLRIPGEAFNPRFQAAPTNPAPVGFQYQGNPAGGGFILVPTATKGRPVIGPDLTVDVKPEPVGTVKGNPPIIPNTKPTVKTDPTKIKLHAQQAIYIDKAALESFKKGQTAMSDGKKSLAEFHFEHALSAFDKQPAGDAKFRQLIETCLKQARSE